MHAIEHVIVDNDDMMPRYCMPFQHPLGPVSELPQNFLKVIDDGAFILCFEERPAMAIFWMLKPLPDDFS
jgi:hypothetical protein